MAQFVDKVRIFVQAGHGGKQPGPFGPDHRGLHAHPSLIGIDHFVTSRANAPGVDSL